MKKYDGLERRRFYRLKYPISASPTLELALRVYRISEISEEGLRFHCAKAKSYRVGRTVAGRIVFRDGTIHKIEGAVLRTTDDEVVVKLSRGMIPFKKIMEEQQFIIRNFPMARR